MVMPQPVINAMTNLYYILKHGENNVKYKNILHANICIKYIRFDIIIK